MDRLQQFNDILCNAISQKTFVRAVLSRPRARSGEFRRVDVRTIELRGETQYQFAKRTATQEFHFNLAPEQSITEIMRLVTADFRDVRVETASEEVQLRTNRRNQAVLSRRQLSDIPQPVSRSHDRTPNYLIPEGVPCDFLRHVGVMDSQGHVRKKSYRKFRQINHYMSLIRSSLDELPAGIPINVVDFGCGKSYLTFATHHLLHNILKRECRVTGLDLRPDVVRTCSDIAEALKIDGLSFAVGDIQSYEPNTEVHLTISLHACDTATDDALFKAIQWQTPVILAVPCCQHELAGLLSEQAAGNPLLTGVMRDRFSALATDSMRACALKAVGYRADIIEFVDTDHTPKNLMIRGIRGPREQQDEGPNACSELTQFREAYRLPPAKLERMLLASGLLKS